MGRVFSLNSIWFRPALLAGFSGITARRQSDGFASKPELRRASVAKNLSLSHQEVLLSLLYMCATIFELELPLPCPVPPQSQVCHHHAPNRRVIDFPKIAQSLFPNCSSLNV